MSAPLSELPQVLRADVYKGSTLAGHLERVDGGTAFTYRDDYTGPDVATTLPRGAGAFAPAGAVPPFFAGLLPEGRRLTALQRAIKTSADDELSLLLAVGTDPIGDVRIVPSGDSPEPAPAADPTELSSVSFAELYARVLSTDPADRVGLPGIQDKLSGGMIALPLQWGARPAILKLTPREFPHLVQDEAFFLQAARDSGLAVPDWEIVHDARGEAGLLVARFDRVPDEDDGGWRRLAQEDGCQVLGAYPADKYRPSSEEVVAALAARCGAPPVAARTFVQQLAFAYLTCNGDAHAKNLSILQDPRGEWRASPAYDVPSTHPYGDTSMALSIDGRRREDIGREHVLALGRAVGVPERATARVIDELLAASKAWVERLPELPFDRRRVHKLGRAIAWRADRLRG